MRSEKRKIENHSFESVRVFRRAFRFSIPSQLFTVLFTFLMFTGCNELQKPKSEPFYAENPTPPRVQEFRWSNGKLPKSFDPAQASASPEADFVRALYEGLTDLDSKTLKPIPAIAAGWTASEDFKTWTFILRKDAKWSNGENVTAAKFVDSWKRLVEMGDNVSQRGLLKNIVGMDTENVLPIFAGEEVDPLSRNTTPENTNIVNDLPEKKLAAENSDTAIEQKPEIAKKEKINPAINSEKELKKKNPFGVEAVNDYTLKVSLVQPDENFPALVAHPMFRPVYNSGKEFESDKLSGDMVTNGAFRVVSIEPNGIVLERAEFYWDAKQIQLERVRFVPTDSAENALASYRAGEVDVVTNVDFKPLALKLLAPYDDFRRTTHSALVYYIFNQDKQPFNDTRVRKALAMSIERERITEDEMDGASHPALSFSPLSGEEKLSQDAAGARKLFTEAGFPDGKDFPVIRLLVNRNDVQRRIARSVAKMWKKNLNVETEIIIKDQADFEAAFQNGEYDIARRGVVLPTTDETANILAIFPPKPETTAAGKQNSIAVSTSSNVSPNNQILNEKSAESNLNFTAPSEMPVNEKADVQASNSESTAQPQVLLTERHALEHVPAIPLYFPTAFSLVKPYIEGFEINALDAPSLKNVKINNNWQPASRKFLSNNQN